MISIQFQQNFKKNVNFDFLMFFRLKNDGRLQLEGWRDGEIPSYLNWKAERGINKFISESERENLILRAHIAVKICGKLPLLHMCSEIWHTIVESPLRNVKLLEEKCFFYFYFL